MAIELVRAPSETPNITSVDDFVGLRHSYGNRDGYIQNKGSELSNTVSGSTFTVNSGRFVIQGVECDIDANGVKIIISNIATKRYHIIYAKISLSSMTAEILEMNDTSSYPSVPSSDDLTFNTIGVAYLELYRFTSQNGSISEVNKTIQKIPYTKELIQALQAQIDLMIPPVGARYIQMEGCKAPAEIYGGTWVLDSNYLNKFLYATESSALGSTGGKSSVALTEANIPRHTHQYTYLYDSQLSGVSSYSFPAGGTGNLIYNANAGGTSPYGGLGSGDKGIEFNITPNYRTICIWKRTK